MKLLTNLSQLAISAKESVTDIRWWYSMLQIVFGCFLVAVAFVVFINPYNLVPGGIYGLALVLHNLFPSIQVGTFGYMFDVPLILTALILFGGTFGGRTIFASFLTPGIMNILDYLVYPNEAAIEALDPALLLGGQIDLSSHLMLAAIIVLSGLLVIGFGIGIDGPGAGVMLSLYSAVCIFVNAKVLGYTIDGASRDKLLYIICEEHSDKMREYILHELNRGGTYLKAKGMYTDNEKEMIFLVVNRKEVRNVQHKIKEFDPKAFVVVTDAYDTFGQGFKPFPEENGMPTE